MWIQPLGAAPVLAPRRALPVDLAGWAGDSIGALAGGAVVGFLVQPGARAAVRGAFAVSGIRTVADAVTHRNDYPVWFLTLLSLYAGVSLWALWQGRKS